MTTVQTLKNNGYNTLFFKNASFHGDTKYVYNDARKELTVYMQVDGMKRKATWRVSDRGEITDLLSHWRRAPQYLGRIRQLPL